MYSSECTLGARYVYNGERWCGNEGRRNSGGGVLYDTWSEATRLSGCVTVTSTAEAPTGACTILL